jgi:cytochrome c oxidase accessory protein FixG
MSQPSSRPAHISPEGHRVKFYPLEIAGQFLHSRRIFGWMLLIFLMAVPWLTWEGFPIFQFDPILRRMIVLGHFFYPSDLQVVVTGIIAGVIGIIVLTAKFGRVWCGWACPQTVYLHWIAEPIERLFEGKAVERKRRDRSPDASLVARRFGRYATILLISAFMGHSFLAYFAGTQTVFFEYWKEPTEHLAVVFFALLFTGALFVDMVLVREVFCTVLCPYARLQSVLVDAQSRMVRYNAQRGEPRRERQSATQAFGDCTNCDLCHKVCPTGIDIRDGFQLECIQCARCVDACDSVMKRTGKPTGLVGYRQGPEARKTHVRTAVYLTLIAVLLSVTAYRMSQRNDFQVEWLRQGNQPFLMRGDTVVNFFQLHVKSVIPRDQRILVPQQKELNLSLSGKTIALAGGSIQTIPVTVRIHKSHFERGKTKIPVVLGSGSEQEIKELTLVGPW